MSNQKSTMLNLADKNNLKKKLSLLIEEAFICLDKEFNKSKCDFIINQLVKGFPRKEISKVLESIELGMRGKFGKSYSLNAQEFCIWIRKHTEPTQEKL